MTPIRRNKFYIVLFAALLGLGMSMPSCPGQQAMQQQVDTLTAQNQELNKRTLNLDNRIRGLEKDMADVKALLKPMGDMVQAQKAQMDQFDANLKEMQTKLAAAASAPRGKTAKPAGKKRR